MMPDSPNLKKIVVFSSPQKKQLIEGLLSDAARATSSTISSTMEHALLYGGLAPTNRNAMRWVNMLYNTPNYNLRNAMSDCFLFLSTKHVDKNSAYSLAFDPLLDFFQFHSLPVDMTGGMFQHEIEYCAVQLNGMATSLRKEANATSDSCLEKEYLTDAEWLSNESKRLDDKAGPIIEYVTLMRTHSEVLAKCSRSYRLMSLICKYVPWLDNPEDRYEFVCMLKDISKDWD